MGGLTLLSVFGAFLGAQTARELFNSGPMIVFWASVVVLLTLSFFSRNLRHNPGLAAMHAAALLIIAGAMWGSDTAHGIRERYFGTEKTPRGFMVLFQGRSGRRIVNAEMTKVLAHLPFQIKLEKFWIETFPDDPTVVKDYKSRLVVIENGREKFRKVIEVNHPLQYGGYHFYQHSYDRRQGQYTILSVTSDSGLTAVYAGFFLLVAGAVWQYYLRPMRRLWRSN